MQYLTVPIVLKNRKTSPITIFPELLKDLKLSKVRKEEKWLAQFFRKDLTETKLERTRKRIKIMLSISPSSVFSNKVHNIRFEKQIRILP